MYGYFLDMFSHDILSYIVFLLLILLEYEIKFIIQILSSKCTHYRVINFHTIKTKAFLIHGGKTLP